MPTITIDERTIDCQDGIVVLQAALDAGWDVPHYCYHPALSVVASCRLCLMEMMAPHPKTGELSWMPKLVPSCQTPVRDGLVVRFNSDAVRANQKSCMEFFLLNHPLDCPVCDQAGECYLQDYSYRFGSPTSRMVEQKIKNPKKDIGPRTLLYQDRCVLCSRCVRFTQEISGTHELTVVNRGSRAEIDVFPGLPLANKLQGNVVDLCPVGCLLDKDFLFKRRVWHLRGTDSICPGCSTGCAIRIDHDGGELCRLKPRFNPGVNDYWMCDEGRFGWKYLTDPSRIAAAEVRRGEERHIPDWADLADILRYRFEAHVAKSDGEVVVLLSPMMACEEAWLLLQFMQSVAPQFAVVLGPAPQVGEDEHFPAGSPPENARFVVRGEKCPNRRGIELIAQHSDRAVIGLQAFIEGCAAGRYTAAWICGGYPERKWCDAKLQAAAAGLDLLVVQDLFPGDLSRAAEILLPFCSWAERQGCFINHDGVAQRFDAAIPPPDGARPDGQVLYELAGFEGLFDARRVRELMGKTMAVFRNIREAVPLPVHQH